MTSTSKTTQAAARLREFASELGNRDQLIQATNPLRGSLRSLFTSKYDYDGPDRFMILDSKTTLALVDVLENNSDENLERLASIILSKEK